MTIELYKNQFQHYLENEKNALTRKSQVLKSECRDDEYKFVQVEDAIKSMFVSMLSESV